MNATKISPTLFSCVCANDAFDIPDEHFRHSSDGQQESEQDVSSLDDSPLMLGPGNLNLLFKIDQPWPLLRFIFSL